MRNAAPRAVFLEVLLSDPGKVPGAMLALRQHNDASRFERELECRLLKDFC